MSTSLLVRDLGRQEYQAVWAAMRDFTDQRTADTDDELWLVEHPPVFTQGQAGKAEHLLAPGDIPVIPTDRGGQVTYHGPGQLVAYPLLNLRRRGLGARDIVTLLENTLIDTLAGYGVLAAADPKAPGVYVGGRKIASIGLRIRRGCSYHGIALNIDLDLAPFRRINPCGYAGLEMVRLCDLVHEPVSVASVGPRFVTALEQRLSESSGV